MAANLAASLTGPDATDADRDRADVLSRLALSRDGTAVGGASALGVDAAMRGQQLAASRLFDYSQRLSRRDLPSQFWAIEQAVGRGDVAAALHHYDIALRTNTDSWDLLFSVLASAAADPAIRAALVKAMSRKPIWGESFVTHIAVRGDDPWVAASLLADLKQAGIMAPDSARSPVVNALVEKGEFDRAWRFYAIMVPGVDRSRSRDTTFTQAMNSPSLLDWTPISDGSITASIQASRQQGSFEFAAPAGVAGAMLRQLQLLPPGRYRLAGHSSGLDQPTQSLPYWILTCQPNGRELGRVQVNPSAEYGGKFSGELVVPRDCPSQMLMLMASPTNAVEGLSGRIDRVQLAPED